MSLDLEGDSDDEAGGSSLIAGAAEESDSLDESSPPAPPVGASGRNGSGTAFLSTSTPSTVHSVPPVTSRFSKGTWKNTVD